MERVIAAKGPIYIGRAGEHQATEVVFDIGRWKTMYGPGSVQLIARRSCEQTVYPVPLRIDGNLAIWTITEADTAISGCSGSCELSYLSETGAIIKSSTWQTYVKPSLDGEMTDPPEAADTWLDELRRGVAEVEEHAETAAQKAAEAEEWAKKAAEGGGPAIDSVTADKVTFADGETFQQKYDSGELTGPVGLTGPAGADGKDGSPGKDGADGKDGAPGEKGDTGPAGPQGEKGEKGDTGATGATGPQGPQGDPGADGSDGKDGITPHIGGNGNWWIGDTDTGVKAKGEDGKDGVGGSGADVYSTEETVVGTWIDGRPIYRKTFVISGTFTVGESTIISNDINATNNELVSVNIIIVRKDGAMFPLTNVTRTDISQQSVVFVSSGNFGISIGSFASANMAKMNITVEYTKLSDPTTTNIPSATALMDAYEEGVNEA